MRHINIPIFIPELACPFQCIFCNQQKISGHDKLPTENEIREIIITHLVTVVPKTTVEIAFFGGSFTGLPLAEQERLLEIPQEFIREGVVQGIRLSTRPDYISDEILVLLKRMNVTAIELGAQSLVDDVLTKSGRGHTVKQVEVASQMILKAGFELGLQMMLGLPGDSKTNAILTAQKIVEFGAQTTRIYPTLVIKETALEKLYLQRKYLPLTIEEAVEQTKEILPIFNKAEVKVLRIGLHPSEGLLSGKDFVAGPFHTNFSEMVQTELWYDKIMKSINLEGNKGGDIELYIHPKDYNFAIGFKAKNRKKLSDYFGSVKFIADSNLKSELEIKILS